MGKKEPGSAVCAETTYQPTFRLASFLFLNPISATFGTLQGLGLAGEEGEEEEEEEEERWMQCDVSPCS